jgi:hypothetical protein
MIVLPLESGRTYPANHRLLEMAGFQLITRGRFWVIDDTKATSARRMPPVKLRFPPVLSV